MKRFLSLLMCVLLFLFAGCSGPSEQMEEEDIRKHIVADNISMTYGDDVAGALWLERYLKVENATFADVFRTSDMSDGFELCFSKWTSGQSAYIVSEVVYESGERYLCDLYELTGITKLHTLTNAYDRISGDERFKDDMKGIGENEYSSGVLEQNITSEAAQTLNSTLLVDESLAAGQLLYGIPSDGSVYTVKIVGTVNGTGIRNIYMCNDERSSEGKGLHMRNKMYYIGYSGNTGDFALVDRQYNETKLCDIVDTADESRRIPSVFGVWDDRFGVYTVTDNDGVVQVGILDSHSLKHTVIDTDGEPVGMYNDALYLEKKTESGSKVVYIPLEDPAEHEMSFDIPDGKVSDVVFSADGRMAVLYAPVDGSSRVAILNSKNGVVLREERIVGKYCEPKYIGFLADGSLMVLSDKKLLCDEFLFIIGNEA